MIDTARRNALKALGIAGALTIGSTTASAQGGPADTARLTFKNQDAADTGIREVTVENVYLPQGGHVVIHDVAAPVGFGAVRGISSELRRGVNPEVTVSVQPASETTAGLVAMAHESGEGFDDPVGDDTAGPPYFNSGAPVVDLAVVG